jgi:DNA primase
MYYYENLNNVSVLKRLPSLDAFSWDADDAIVFDTDEQLIQQVLTHYTDTLKSSEVAKDFLSNRGLCHPDVINHFSLGFSNRTLGKKLHVLGDIQEELLRGSLQRIGLLKPSGHEFFRGSILFPFFDKDGNVTGAYGRRITQKLKAYSVYHVHWVSEQTTFFNLSVLSEYKEVILCKSPLEALTFWCLGFKNVIATMGLLGFGEHHVDKLKHYGITSVFIALENTVAGNKAAAGIERRLLDVHILSCRLALPNHADVNQSIRSVFDPKQLLRSVVGQAVLH